MSGELQKLKPPPQPPTAKLAVREEITAMIDVHAPDHKLQGARDFAIHLLTITAGLLIAIALEQSVEAIHHRHQRKEAEALIRQELAHNREQLQQGSVTLKQEIDGMTSVLEALNARTEGKPLTPVKEGELHFSEGPIQDSAWRTASTTGVLSYMDYAEVERFSDAYKEQYQLEAMEQLAMNDYLQIMPILKSQGPNISPDTAKEALPYARNAMGHLSGMYFIGAGTIGAYNDALK